MIIALNWEMSIAYCLIEDGGVEKKWLLLTQAIRHSTLPYMATKEEIRARILKAINTKAGKTPVCSICGHNAWRLGSGYAALSAEKHPLGQTAGGMVFPLVPLLCTHCGNTHLLNLFYLGFTKDDWDSLELSGDG